MEKINKKVINFLTGTLFTALVFFNIHHATVEANPISEKGKTSCTITITCWVDSGGTCAVINGQTQRGEHVSTVVDCPDQ